MIKAQLLFYFFYIGLNIVLNIYFFLGSRKHNVYKWTSIFWIAALSFYLLEGLLENTKFIGFSLIIASVTNFAVLKICSLLMGIKYKKTKLDIYVSLILILLGILTSYSYSFEIYTSFFALAATFPYFNFILTNIKKINKNNGLEKFMILTYSLNVIHILDYPFLRLNKDFAYIGFNIAFFFGVILSLFIYITSDSIYIKTIEEKLRLAIEEKNKIYKRLVATKLIKSFSHELNNSLQNIICSQEILEKKTSSIKDDDFNEINENIRDSVKKIQNILSPFYKNEDSSSKEEVFLNNVLNDSKSLLEVYSNNKKIVLNNIDNSQTFLYIQRGLFTQIIVNIAISILKNEEKLETSFFNNRLIFSTLDEKTIDLDFPIILSNQIGLKIEKEKRKIILDLKNFITSQEVKAS